MEKLAWETGSVLPAAPQSGSDKAGISLLTPNPPGRWAISRRPAGGLTWAFSRVCWKDPLLTPFIMRVGFQPQSPPQLQLQLLKKVPALCVGVCMPSCCSRVWLSGTPWTVAHQVPLSTGFPRQEDWSGLPFSSSGGLPNPGIKPACLTSPALAGGFFTSSTTRVRYCNWARTEGFSSAWWVLYCHLWERNYTLPFPGLPLLFLPKNPGTSNSRKSSPIHYWFLLPHR